MAPLFSAIAMTSGSRSRCSSNGCWRFSSVFGGVSTLLARVGALWRNGVPGGAAYQGNWHPPGAGRGHRLGRLDSDARGGRCRRRDWSRRRLVRHALDPGATFRHPGDRPVYHGSGCVGHRLSGYFSARRATTIDPVRALRGSSAERCGAARSGRPREAGVASAAVRGDRPTIKLNVCGTTHAFCPLRRAPR